MDSDASIEFKEIGEDEDFFNGQFDKPAPKKQKAVHDSYFTNRILKSSDFLNKDP